MNIPLRAAVSIERHRAASGLFHCPTCADERTVHLVPDCGAWSANGPGDDPCIDCTDGEPHGWHDCPVCDLVNGVADNCAPCLGCDVARMCIGCEDVTATPELFGSDWLCTECMTEARAEAS